MTAISGSGHQWLFGGPGDTLKAGTGTDTFMFAPNFGNETIKNFNSHDVIEFPTSLFANYHHVLDSVAPLALTLSSLTTLLTRSRSLTSRPRSCIPTISL